MSSEYKDRYGIPGASVKHLIRKFYRYLLDSDWYNADSYVKWCSENNWQKGLRLCKKDTSLPHGPDNSFFKKPEMTVRAKKEDVRRRKEERKNLVSPFCVGCEKNCSRTASGCEEWQKYFKQNWNQNIYVAPKKTEQKTVDAGPQVWRYEHPDLVREGIVFDPSKSEVW